VITTGDFYIELLNSNGYSIATLTSGLSYDTVKGPVLNMVMTAGNSMINSVTTLTLSF
jgi:hypothetical protein